MKPATWNHSERRLQTAIEHLAQLRHEWSLLAEGDPARFLEEVREEIFELREAVDEIFKLRQKVDDALTAAKE